MEKRQLFFMITSLSWKGDNAVNILKNIKGYVYSDEVYGYNKLYGITGCGVRLQRKFVEAVPTKKAEGTSLTQAEIGKNYCNQLFKIQKGLKDLSSE